MTATSPARDDARVRALQAKVDLMAFSVDFTRMSDVAMRPVKWLWRGRIAQGKVTLVAGHPGLGKSQIAASFAAITTTGGRWPVDRTEAPCGSVVILSAEDDPEDTIGPRLMAAGADLTRVYVARAIRECDDDGVERRRHIDLGRDLEHLDGADRLPRGHRFASHLGRTGDHGAVVGTCRTSPGCCRRDIPPSEARRCRSHDGDYRLDGVRCRGAGRLHHRPRP